VGHYNSALWVIYFVCAATYDETHKTHTMEGNKEDSTASETDEGSSKHSGAYIILAKTKSLICTSFHLLMI
jgi:hypothetical protein